MLLDSPQFFTLDLASKVFIVVITIVLTASVTILVERYKNRNLYLKKSIDYQLIGMTSTSHWGDIKILYNNNLINNVYLFNVTIFNHSNLDAPKDLEVIFSVNNDSFFLREFGQITNGDVVRGLKLRDQYWRDFTTVYNSYINLDEQARLANLGLKQQLDYFNSEKPFILPILNRKTSATFSFLIGSNGADIPILNIGVYEPNIKIEWFESVQQKERRKIWKGGLMMIL